MLFYSSFPDSFGLIHTVFANRLLQKEKEKPKKKKRKKKQPKKTKKIENCENNWIESAKICLDSKNHVDLKLWYKW